MNDKSTCRKCGEKIIKGEPDPCLGYLPGIAHACCGHGEEKKAYCVYWPGCKPNETFLVNELRKNTVRKTGKEAIDHMESLRS